VVVETDEEGRPEHFQTWSGQEKLERLMSQNPDSFDREMLNIGTKPTLEAAFRKEWIDAMVSKTYKDTHRTINHLFVTIDPSAAKDRNLYVVTSAFFIDGQCVVCCCCWWCWRSWPEARESGGT